MLGYVLFDSVCLEVKPCASLYVSYTNVNILYDPYSKIDDV